MQRATTLRVVALLACLALLAEWWLLFGARPLPFVLDLIGGRSGYQELWTERTSSLDKAIIYARLAEVVTIALAALAVMIVPRTAFVLVVLALLLFAAWLGLSYREELQDFADHGGTWNPPPFLVYAVTSGILFAIALVPLFLSFSRPDEHLERPA